ncbi:MAG: PAS domain-containing sensor histidine kinase [Limnobacter sp.]|nr:PAS domain-containing sensor histidine kinase [Limnobacter sp.]
MPTSFQAFDCLALELLATAVVLCSPAGDVLFANAQAEQLFQVSRRSLEGSGLAGLFSVPGLFSAFLAEAHDAAFEVKVQIFEMCRPDGILEHVQILRSCPDNLGNLFVLELREIEQQMRVDREARLRDQSLANKELIRNLAHEIKNPLGGIRGAAQLLEAELPSAELREYTQIVIQESDRLQTLVDRLLAPHRRPHIVGQMNIHEVCERVRSVILAEYPKGLQVRRDYDVSIPEFMGDFEQLIQALLNVVRNAAQALDELVQQHEARITMRTRVVRRLTLNRHQYRLALELQITDNGPGIPVDIQERIFSPLVSGRENGSGLGLTLAQTFVQQHGGVIECQSQPGHTCFTMVLPLEQPGKQPGDLTGHKDLAHATNLDC